MYLFVMMAKYTDKWLNERYTFINGEKFFSTKRTASGEPGKLPLVVP
jgi:hypothetical protein